MGGKVRVRRVGEKKDRKEKGEYIPAEPGGESIPAFAPCERWYE